MQLSDKLDNAPLRSSSAYEHNDLLVYLSFATFLAMAVMLYAILSL